MSATLYAWANPLQSPAGFVDHTWVTDYPFINNQYPTIGDIPSGANYWYCWGIYHSSGNGGVNHNPNGAIGSQSGDVSTSKSLVKPDVPAPHFPGGNDPQNGSIFYYAIDGVCHMVANQALFATGTSTTDPLRVTEANGYSISSFFYGDYGLNSATWDSLVQQYAPNNKVPSDYFDQWLVQMGFTLKQVGEIEACRLTSHAAFEELHIKVPSMSTTEVYAAILVVIVSAFAAVEKSVGTDGFLKLFPAFKGFPSTNEEAAYWIDQDQFVKGVQLPPS